MLIFEDCANSALPARFLPLPRRFFLRRNGAGCFRRHVSYAPKGRCDMRRRLRRSAGHIFSAPEWRVVPPAAHSFLSCQKRMGRKEAPGTRNRAVAPEKVFFFCVPFTDRAFRKERPSGGPQNFCCLKFCCGKYLCLQNRKVSVPNPCGAFRFRPFLLRSLYWLRKRNGSSKKSES